jgi:hypothetical protein
VFLPLPAGDGDFGALCGFKKREISDKDYEALQKLIGNPSA